MTNVYDVGDLVTLTGTFTSALGVATDPTAIVLTIKPPSGSLITKTYALAELTKASTGVYTYDYPITLEGEHWYRYVGTGAVTAAGETDFTVRTQQTK